MLRRQIRIVAQCGTGIISREPQSVQSVPNMHAEPSSQIPSAGLRKNSLHFENSERQPMTLIEAAMTITRTELTTIEV